MGALKPAEAGAPATPSKEAKRDPDHKTVAERTVTRHRNPHAYPSEEAEIEKIKQRKGFTETENQTNLILESGSHHADFDELGRERGRKDERESERLRGGERE